MRTWMALSALTLAACAWTAAAAEPPVPRLAFKSTENYVAGGRPHVRYRLDVQNKSAFSADLFMPSPGLPSCGTNTSAARSWVDVFDEKGARLYGFCGLRGPGDLGDIWFAVPQGNPPPASVYIVLKDRLTQKSYTSNKAPIPALSAASSATPALQTSPTVAEIQARVCHVHASAIEAAVEARFKVKTGAPEYDSFQTATNAATTDEYNRQGCALLIEGPGVPGRKDFTATVLDTVLNKRPTTGGAARHQPIDGLCTYSQQQFREASAGMSRDAAQRVMDAVTTANGCRVAVDEERLLARGRTPSLTVPLVAAAKRAPAAAGQRAERERPDTAEPVAAPRSGEAAQTRTDPGVRLTESQLQSRRMEHNASGRFCRFEHVPELYIAFSSNGEPAFSEFIITPTGHERSLLNEFRLTVRPDAPPSGRFNVQNSAFRTRRIGDAALIVDGARMGSPLATRQQRRGGDEFYDHVPIDIDASHLAELERGRTAEVLVFDQATGAEAGRWTYDVSRLRYMTQAIELAGGRCS